jgi:nucleoside-diphosphate-sugar epimerase
MKDFVVTGATGFVGGAVLQALQAAGIGTTQLVRARTGASPGTGSTQLAVGDNFADIADAWPASLRPECVIHLAARVHVMRDTAADPLEAFRATNVIGTMRVAQAAVRAGVRRFVYVSSIKAVGETERGGPLRESDTPRPTDPYGISKYEAECELFEFGYREGLEVVVIRPPLVYGPGVGANFLNLMRAVAKGVPLPLGCAVAPRSLVALDNLASAIVWCAHHLDAAGEVFHVSDGDDVSVSELVQRMGTALGEKAKLVPVPVFVLRAMGALTGRKDVIQRLVEPLRLDTTKIRSVTGWAAPETMQASLARTAAWYRALQIARA